MRFGDDREPLEMGQGSKKKNLLVCPNCFSGRYASVNTFSLECGNCKKYFRASDSASKEQCNDLLNNSENVSPEYVKLRTGVEQRAENYRQKQAILRKDGKVKSHEPGFAKRDWGKK